MTTRNTHHAGSQLRRAAVEEQRAGDERDRADDRPRARAARPARRSRTRTSRGRGARAPTSAPAGARSPTNAPMTHERADQPGEADRRRCRTRTRSAPGPTTSRKYAIDGLMSGAAAESPRSSRWNRTSWLGWRRRSVPVPITLAVDELHRTGRGGDGLAVELHDELAEGRPHAVGARRRRRPRPSRGARPPSLRAPSGSRPLRRGQRGEAVGDAGARARARVVEPDRLPGPGAGAR